MGSVKLLYRYPVKGLNGQSLSQAELRPCKAIKADRAYAIAHGSTEFDPSHPVHLRKMKFLTLMTHPRLAELAMEYDEEGNPIRLYRKRMLVVDSCSCADQFAAAVNSYLNDFIGLEAKGAPRLVTAPNHMFSDVPEDCISVINLASLAAVEAVLGFALDPLRFRANICLGGLTAWQERDWQEGDMLQIGNATLRVMRHITRCAAPNVNLQTAVVDADIPTLLHKHFEQNLMGAYAEVVSGAMVSVNDKFQHLSRAEK